MAAGLSPSPAVPANPEERLRRQIKWLLLLRVCLLTIFLGISSILRFNHPSLNLPSVSAVAFFFLFIYLFSIASALLCARLTRLTLFVYGQVLSDCVLSTVMVFASGGSESIFTFLYFFPIISAGLLLLRRGGLRVAGAGIIGYGLVLAADRPNLAALLPDNFRIHASAAPVVLLQSFLIYGLSFLLVALLSAFLAERLYLTETALNQASRHLDFVSQLYKQIFDDLTSGIITVDAGGRITSFNRAAEEISGYLAAEVLNRELWRLFPGLHQPVSAEARPVIEMTRKDGATIPVGYSWGRLNLRERGEDCRVYTLQDLSRIRRMEEQMRQSEKMAAIGKIAAGIAHEFRNPLAAISGAAQVLDQDQPVSAANRSLLNIIIRECARLEANITDFLQFSKPAVPEQTWVPLSALIDECWTIIKRGVKFKDNCRLATNIPVHLECWADHYQIKQVLLNLLHNACLALENGGRIEVLAREEGGEEGGRTVIEVRDDGCGIPDAMQQDIFAPFFTTRENGTGLGLAIVQQIVEGHQGAITVSSQPGQGATFTLVLPLPQ